MPVEYKFLRFEIVGIATILYTTGVLLPLIFDDFRNFLSTDISAAVAFIGSLFIFSIPLGYIMHQLAVNIYRSETRETDIFRILDSYIIKEIRNSDELNAKDKNVIETNYNNQSKKEKNSFLTSLIDYFAHKDKLGDLYDRIEVRWSHFYARKSVGKYAPIASAPLAFLTGLLLYISTDWIELETCSFIYSLSLSIVFWVIILLFSLIFIEDYAKKILIEIECLEKIIFFSVKKDKIEYILKEIFLDYFLNNQNRNSKKSTSFFSKYSKKVNK